MNRFAMSLAGAVVCLAVMPAPASFAGSFKVLHYFDNNGRDGAVPTAALVGVQGTLYGTTSEGGSKGFTDAGTVFAIDPFSGYETVIHSFQDGDGVLAGDLVDVKGTLYGMTYYGGTFGLGTIFEMNRKKGTVTTLHSFRDDGSDGYNPRSGLLNIAGTLYGMTWRGGTENYGTVFSIDPTTHRLVILHSFDNDDGAQPVTDLIDVDGALYGTTPHGGRCTGTGCGLVFRLDFDGTETVLHEFRQHRGDGAFPDGPLLKTGHLLYGTTPNDGAAGYGTIYSIDPSTGAEKIEHSFVDSDGSEPVGGLITVNGLLYGTTAAGGDYNHGTVFAFDPATGVLTVLHSFNGTDGSMPLAGLLYLGTALFGTTFEGGKGCHGFGCGTVFRINLEN